MISNNDQWNIENNVFGSIINQLPHYIFWKDKNYVFRGCNQLHAEQFGLKDQSEIIGKTDADFAWLNPYMNKYLADDKEVMQTGKAKLHYEEVIHQRNGEPKVVLISKIPLVDSQGNINGVLGIYTDITERKKFELELKASKEAAETASHAKTEFIRNMSHDLRTPLTGIIGMAEMLSQTPSAKMTYEAAQDIQQAGSSLLNLLNEIIETVQIESGKTIEKKRCFSFNSTLQTLTNIFKPAMKQKGLKLETYFDDNIPDILYGQELLFHRIVLNLLGNAVKFTEKGSISLEASLLQKRSNSISVKLVVQDTGIGIPKDKQTIIFEKFSRLTPSYTNIFKGSGLGLFMVREYIQKLGGEITVNSTEGKGSTFTCTVDFKLPTPKQLAQYQKKIEAEKALIQKISDASEAVKSRHTKPLHTLLVEDTLLSQKLAKSLLMNAGYEVETAETAAEALKKSQLKKFDVIYMDLGLPDGSGIDVTQAVRQDKSNPNTNTLIVALTAHSDEEIKQNSIAVGIQDIIDKPLTSEKINATEMKLLNLLQPNDKELPIFDMVYMTSLMDNNVDLAQESLDIFVETLPQIRKQLAEAYQQQDWAKLKHLVHKLHGDLCYSGALRLKAAVHKLEHALIEETNQYESLYENTIAEIDTFLEAV